MAWLSRVAAWYRLQEDTGAAPPSGVLHSGARHFALSDLWSASEALDNKVPAAVQLQMFIEIGRLVVRASVWFLRRRREKFPISEVLEIFRPGVASVSADLKQYLSRGDAQALQVAADGLTAQGVPPEIAARVASLDALFSVLDIVEVSAESKRSIELVAAIYFSSSDDSICAGCTIRCQASHGTHWQYQTHGHTTTAAQHGPLPAACQTLPDGATRTRCWPAGSPPGPRKLHAA
jgi:NAD-specific glutamate dehydrogenase